MLSIRVWLKLLMYCRYFILFAFYDKQIPNSTSPADSYASLKKQAIKSTVKNEIKIVYCHVKKAIFPLASTCAFNFGFYVLK